MNHELPLPTSPHPLSLISLCVFLFLSLLSLLSFAITLNFISSHYTLAPPLPPHLFSASWKQTLFIHRFRGQEHHPSTPKCCAHLVSSPQRPPQRHSSPQGPYPNGLRVRRVAVTCYIVLIDDHTFPKPFTLVGIRFLANPLVNFSDPLSILPHVPPLLHPIPFFFFLHLHCCFTSYLGERASKKPSSFLVLSYPKP